MTSPLSGRTRAWLVAGLALAAVAAAPDRRFHFVRDLIRAGDRAGDAVLTVPLDASVFGATRDGFPDLRVVDDRGREVAYALERATRRRTCPEREEVAARVVSLELRDDAIEVVAELDPDAPSPQGATIHTPLRDFERRVRVFGSADGGAWEVLADDGRIFDYSRHMDVRNLDVPFPARRFRRFKLAIERESDEQKSPFYELIREREGGEPGATTEVARFLHRPFRIDRVSFHREVDRTVEEKVATLRARLELAGVGPDRDGRATQIEVEAGRLPLSRLALRTSTRNFDRPARVLAAVGDGPNPRWEEIGRGRLYRHRLGTFRDEGLELEFAERRADRLRIVVEDGDSPPLDVLGVDGDRSDVRLAFLGEPGRRYRLAYGSDASDPPSYDTEAVLAALGPEARREAVALGPPQANPDYRPSRRPWIGDAAALALALILMAAVLAWAIVQAVRRADKAKDGDFDG